MKKRVGTVPKLDQKAKNDAFIKQLLLHIDSLRKKIGLEPLQWSLQWLDVHNKLILQHPSIHSCLQQMSQVVQLFQLFCHMLNLCLGTQKQRQAYCQKFIDHKKVQDRPFLESCQKALRCGDLMARRMLQLTLEIRMMQLAVKEVDEHMKLHERKMRDEKRRGVRATMSQVILTKLGDGERQLIDLLNSIIKW